MASGNLLLSAVLPTVLGSRELSRFILRVLIGLKLYAGVLYGEQNFTICVIAMEKPLVSANAAREKNRKWRRELENFSSLFIRRTKRAATRKTVCHPVAVRRSREGRLRPSRIHGTREGHQILHALGHPWPLGDNK